LILVAAIEELAQKLPVNQACELFGMVRSTLYRSRQPKAPPAKRVRPQPARTLSGAERSQVHELLNSERFVDQSPYEIYATLLDEGSYLCSIRTMYRVLQEQGEVRERRNQLRHPYYRKPELLATAPNQLWSWDITKLRGPATWCYYYLYVMLDVFSRYVVGWLLAEVESTELAEHLVSECCRKQSIKPQQLTIHADRGAVMVAKSLAQLFSDLGIDPSHSRPYTPDDNPFSESQFKTMKYRPTYPDRFESYSQAIDWCRAFFDWYNHQHHHTALGLLTPAVVHLGKANETLTQRQATLDSAYALHPNRFVRGVPVPPTLPAEVWINPPPSTKQTGTTNPDKIVHGEAPLPRGG
jgi:putative transposase